MIFKTYLFESITSTQNIAKNFPPYSVILADTQTNGRGRCGRKWESQSGNLFMTLVLPQTLDAFQVHTLTLQILKKLLLQWIPSPEIFVKPPNDLLIHGKKISGILLENHDDKILLGIGMNIVSSPQKIDQKTTSLHNLGIGETRDSIVEKILSLMNESLK